MKKCSDCGTEYDIENCPECFMATDTTCEVCGTICCRSDHTS